MHSICIYFVTWIIGGYANQPIVITKASADKVRDEIKALGYPESEDNFEYICDNKVDVFRNNTFMTPGTASVSRNKITVNGSSGVAAYEVQDSQGKVSPKWVSPTFSSG